VTSLLGNTAGRDNGRRRPKGYAAWRPQRRTVALLDQVSPILDEYEDYLPMTVRQLFYRLVGAYGYDKTELAYNRLAEHLVRARRARIIPFDAIRDDGVVTYPSEWYADVDAFSNETGRRARNYWRDRQEGQRQRLELWTEAAGMAPQLARVAHDYSIPVYSTGGFSSLTAVRQIVDRALGHHHTILLHVGDYDPSGEAIFDAIGADAIAFLEADKRVASQTIEARRVALTADQVAAFDLATAPAKATDSRTKNWAGSETCQLEALAPDQLATVVRTAIETLIDTDMLNAQLAHEQDDRAELLGLPPGSAS
jgi:hypothetical protein